ncbi:MAG: acyl carrier protein [Bacteroidales bacterium]|nr:acyl carrier protein [Bacteroidales bacterium]
MFEKVQAILAKQLRLDPSKITLESRIMKDLGADSLDILQLLMRIEDQYGIVIPDQALAKFDTVADVVSYLENQEAKLYPPMNSRSSEVAGISLSGTGVK